MSHLLAAIVSGGSSSSVSAAVEPSSGACVTRPLTIGAGLRSLATDRRRVRGRGLRQLDAVWDPSQGGGGNEVAPVMARLVAKLSYSRTSDLAREPVTSLGRKGLR